MTTLATNLPVLFEIFKPAIAMAEIDIFYFVKCNLPDNAWYFTSHLMYRTKSHHFYLMLYYNQATTD